jgi:hypothetical protein
MPEAPSSRLARLVVCGADGTILGSTRDVVVPSPYWSHVESLVTATADQLGLQITVVRLLAVEPGVAGAPDRTTYLAQSTGPIGVLAPPSPQDQRASESHPLRMPWAVPGGPAAQLAWAEQELEGLGIHLSAPPVQVRTWHLSSIWRLPTTSGTVWLKAVPWFFAHEAVVIERLAGLRVPSVLAHADGICLLASIDGDDLHEPGDDQALAMIDAMVDIQRGPGADIRALLDLGLPDWRIPALTEPAAHALEARAADLDVTARRVLEALIAGFEVRQRQLVECGIPDSLVHGDLHPGNVRGRGVDITILDWGDSGIGHPLLDVAAFTERMPAAQRALAERHWMKRWQHEMPGSDPTRAEALVAPVAALRQALIYRKILDHIEPVERAYHEAEDLVWLRRTVELRER